MRHVGNLCALAPRAPPAPALARASRARSSHIDCKAAGPRAQGARGSWRAARRPGRATQSHTRAPEWRSGRSSSDFWRLRPSRSTLLVWLSTLLGESMLLAVVAERCLR